ncbi:nucleotidyl transferase AbiEii/AbiGii toxin family protein [Patescibacteria group bacterium]
MILPSQKEAVHKAWLYRLLKKISDNLLLASSLYFKGGTCAAMLGHLDRFSVDLDFDFVAKKNDVKNIQKNLETIFKNLGLEIKYKSQRTPQYFLKYPVNGDGRNTIKIDITMPPPKANKYNTATFRDIDRILTCQTIETMFANKLVALIDRFEKNNSIAGRDLYDIHYFFMREFRYNANVIIERRGKELIQFFDELILFIEKNITETIINEDLNYLLPIDKFQKIRNVLKNETLMFLRDEKTRIKNN